MKPHPYVSAIFQILVGTGIWGIWILNFMRGSIPELQSEPIRIAMHLLAEACTGSLLLISGFSILLRKRKRHVLFQVAMGALLYTLIASPGYFAQQGQWGVFGIFLGMLTLTVVLLILQDGGPSGERRKGPLHRKSDTGDAAIR